MHEKFSLSGLLMKIRILIKKIKLSIIWHHCVCQKSMRRISDTQPNSKDRVKLTFEDFREGIAKAVTYKMYREDHKF